MIQIQKRWLFLCFLLTFPVYSKNQNRVPPSIKIKPLVLQWEVSHPRNTDQISLIFRENTVELVTNTSSYQKDKKIRLGRFQSPLTLELKMIKEQIKRHRTRLKQTVPVLSLIKDSRIPRLKPDPHAPLLRINEETIQAGSPHFKSLAPIIYEIWEQEWTCVECATYKKRRKSIIRTIKKLKSSKDSPKNTKKSKNKWSTTKQRFLKKFFNCVPKEKKKVECVDSQFGIFEI